MTAVTDGLASPHAATRDDEDSISYYRTMQVAVQELLIAKGVFSAADVTATVAAMDARTTARGAAVVARAWLDAAFKHRLLTDAPTACAELGLEMGPLKLIVIEDTPDTHNVVVCTLCSCYPRMLLGIPPDWYKSREYRSRCVREPRAVLREFGTDLPDTVRLRVHDSTADMRYMVLPLRPTNTAHLSQTELAKLVTRDSLIGVTLL